MDKKIRLIQHFLEGNLTDGEKKEFKKLSLEDEEFRRMIVRAAEFNTEFNLMFPDGEAGKGIVPTRLKRKQIYLYSVISIAVFIIMALVIAALVRKPLNNRIFAESYSPITIDIFRGPRQKDSLTHIQKLYISKEYKSIRNLVRNNDPTIQLTDLDYLLAGISFMENEEWVMAEKQLKIIPKSSEQYPNSAWYIALIYLKRGDIDKCREYLDEAEGSMYFGRKVEELRKDLPHP